MEFNKQKVKHCIALIVYLNRKLKKLFFASYLSFIIKIKTLVNKQQANYNEKILILRNRNGYFLIFNVTLGILWFYYSKLVNGKNDLHNLLAQQKYENCLFLGHFW